MHHGISYAAFMAIGSEERPPNVIHILARMRELMAKATHPLAAP